MSESYRRPPPREPEPPPPREEGELDAAAFARRQQKRAIAEDRAREARIETANRQLRIGAALVLLLGLSLLALAAPSIGSGYAFRGSYRGLVMGPTLVSWAVFTLATGTGGSERLADAPTWIRIGQVVAPLLGALAGALLAEL